MAITEATGKGRVAEGRKTAIDSKIAEGTIAFGTGVKYGTNAERQVLQWDGGDDILAGIAVYSTGGHFDDEQYEQYDRVSVLRKGIVWMEVDTDSSGVTVGETPAITPNGDVEADSNLSSGSTGNYAVTVTNGEIKTDGSAGDLVKVEVNFPTPTTNTDLA